MHARVGVCVCVYFSAYVIILQSGELIIEIHRIGFSDSRCEPTVQDFLPCCAGSQTWCAKNAWRSAGTCNILLSRKEACGGIQDWERTTAQKVVRQRTLSNVKISKHSSSLVMHLPALIALMETSPLFTSSMDTFMKMLHRLCRSSVDGARAPVQMWWRSSREYQTACLRAHACNAKYHQQQLHCGHRHLQKIWGSVQCKAVNDFD